MIKIIFPLVFLIFLIYLNFIYFNYNVNIDNIVNLENNNKKYIYPLGNFLGFNNILQILKNNKILDNKKKYIYVDIGLNNKGIEFKQAIDSGYTVIGFESNINKYIYLKNYIKQFYNSHNFTFIDNYKYLNNITINNRDIILINVKLNKFHLDHIIKENIFILKLDTEGYDFNILKNSKYLFKNNKINMLFLKLWPQGLIKFNTNINEFLEYLIYFFNLNCFTNNKINNVDLYKFSEEIYQNANEVLKKSIEDKYYNLFCYNPNFEWIL